MSLGSAGSGLAVGSLEQGQGCSGRSGVGCPPAINPQGWGSVETQRHSPQLQAAPQDRWDQEGQEGPRKKREVRNAWGGWGWGRAVSTREGEVKGREIKGQGHRHLHAHPCFLWFPSAQGRPPHPAGEGDEVDELGDMQIRQRSGGQHRTHLWVRVPSPCLHPLLPRLGVPRDQEAPQGPAPRHDPWDQ